jgi:peptidoglycan/xylan/chitin deacetylase (PgdA/CDA1 family)
MNVEAKPGFQTTLAAALLRGLPAARSNRLLTLIYHRVRPEVDPMFPGEVVADGFHTQMSLLRRYCHPIALQDAVGILRGGGKLPPRAVAITFDDGYLDNVTQALPILVQHGIPATFFVATSFLGSGIMWNDAVIEGIRAASVRALKIPSLGVDCEMPSDPSGRGRLAEVMLRKIKHLPQADRSERVRDIVRACDAPPPDKLMMDAAGVRALHAAGMEVGAHTRTHPILATLDEAAVLAEIQGSREDLENIIGVPVRAFAYPNGRPGEDYGPRERSMVESLGFQYAPSTRWGVARAGTDLFQLPRFTPWDRDPTRWLARLLLAFRKPVE